MLTPHMITALQKALVPHRKMASPLDHDLTLPQYCSECPRSGFSVRFFGSKGSINFVKILKPSNCSSSLMCNFENGGFGWFLWSYSSKTCLNCLKYI